TLVNETTFGRIAVFALCTRGTAGSTVILNDFPPLINDGATQAAGCSYSLRILGARISGSFDGLTVTLEAGSIDGIYGSGLDIAHMVVHRTLAGSPTVTDTTDFTHALATSSNAPLGGSLTTDLCTVAINSAHDYYIVVHTGTGRNLKYAVLPPTFSPASTVGVSLSIARDATADTTINSDYNLDTAYWRIFSGTSIVLGSGLPPPGSGTPADDFTEIDPSTFAPGQTLRASTMAQLDLNVQEAVASPEVFGPTEYAN